MTIIIIMIQTKHNNDDDNNIDNQHNNVPQSQSFFIGFGKVIPIAGVDAAVVALLLLLPGQDLRS